MSKGLDKKTEVPSCLFHHRKTSAEPHYVNVLKPSVGKTDRCPHPPSLLLRPLLSKKVVQSERGRAGQGEGVWLTHRARDDPSLL